MRRLRLRLAPVAAGHSPPDADGQASGAGAWKPPLLLLLAAGALALLATGATPATAAPGPLINSGHAGTITDLRYDAQRRLLFSAGDDGAVRVWDQDNATIVQHLRLGVHRVVRIALHPEGTLLAAVLRSATGSNLLEVWDWRAGRRLYGHPLAEPPLHVGFTSRGSSLVYTKAQLDSVVFLEPYSGQPQHRLPPGIGIVSFVTTSTNERTIMTYQPTGRIRYWDSASARLQAEVATVPGLEQIAVSADKALLVARAGDEIVAIDVVTGRVRSRVAAPDQVVFTVSDRLPQLILLETAPPESGGGVVVRRLRLDRRLTGYREATVDLSGAVTAVAAADSAVFIAQPGSIVEFRSGAVRTFARNELLPGAELVVADGTLVVATRWRLALARTASTASARAADSGAPGTRDSLLPQVVSQQHLVNPFRAAVGLTLVAPIARPRSPSRSLVLVWNREGESGGLGTLDPRTGTFRFRLAGLPAPLVQVSVLDRQLLLLDRNGEIRLYSLTQVLGADPKVPLPPEHRFRAPGTSKVAGTGQRLIAGRSSASATATPLLQIDTATAETILLADDALLIYDLAQHADGHLLTLGVEAADATAGRAHARTVLKRRSGSNLEQQRILDAYAGEDLFAALAVAPDGRRVYSSLGPSTVRMWDGRRLVALERSGHRPRQLTVVDSLLVARNADGTFTVWDRATHAVLFDLYLFRGFDWLAVARGGHYTHSPGAMRYLRDGLGPSGR